MKKVVLSPFQGFRMRITHNINLIKGAYTVKQFGDKVGLKEGTARNRLKNPLSLTLAELFIICERYHINIADFVGKDLKIQ